MQILCAVQGHANILSVLHHQYDKPNKEYSVMNTIYITYRTRSPHTLIKWSRMVVLIFTGNGVFFTPSYGPVKSRKRGIFISLYP